MKIVNYKSVAELQRAIKQLRIKVLNNMKKCKLKSTIWKESPLVADGYTVDWKTKLSNGYGNIQYCGLTVESVIKQVVMMEIGNVAYINGEPSTDEEIDNYFEKNKFTAEDVIAIGNYLAKEENAKLN